MSPVVDISIAQSVAFNQFTLDPRERLLKFRGASVSLGGRAMDILLLLVEQAGEVVSKQELLMRIWPGITVGEGVLRVHISALRKALGDCQNRRHRQNDNRYIASISGRGYCFVAPIERKCPQSARASGPWGSISIAATIAANAGA